MLAIKLQRIGRKHQPSYRIVVAERRSKLNGPPVEDIGSYNTFSKAFNIKMERVKHWLKVGAQPTIAMHNLLVKHGVLTVPKIRIPMKKKEGTAPLAATATATSAPVVAASSTKPVGVFTEATKADQTVAEIPVEASA